MKLNADFRDNVLVPAGDHDFVASPMPGVTRMMLDRVGDEVARATTIVRFAPGSRFSAHTHDGGEEFLVLDGVFEDEHGAFPKGAYIRNPPTSRHTPRSSQGCVLFVKLWQFDPEDRQEVRLDTAELDPVADEARPGVAVSPLFRRAGEDVRFEVWAPGTRARVEAPGGAEILVVDGAGAAGGERLDPWSWLRRAPGQAVDLSAGEDGMRLWVKTGHLDRMIGRPGPDKEFSRRGRP